MASPIDKIFEEIFGHSLAKRGTAFEQIAAIAVHIINGGEVRHDDKLRGEFSKSLYQLDVLHKTDEGFVMGEAKDYSDRNEKVGRGDLQKLGGALPDLKEIDAGVFFSATGYTKPAQQYAKQSKNITGKPISLYGLRPSTELDEEGRIKTIIIKIHISMPQTQSAKWIPHVTAAGQEALNTLLKNPEDSFECKMKVDYFYNKSGEKKLSIEELTSYGYGNINKETDKTNACFLLKDSYMKINGVLAELHGLEYEMPYSYHTQEMRISNDSENKFVLLDGEGNILKFLSDEMLREYEFDENKNLKKKKICN